VSAYGHKLALIVHCPQERAANAGRDVDVALNGLRIERNPASLPPARNAP